MCNCLDKHSRFGEKHPAFSFLFLSVPRVEGPDHNLWVKFAKQVSSLSFPSCSTSNQIEKKQENYNFRLALSLGNISQKRKHKNPEEKLPTRDVGYIHGGNIILLLSYYYPTRAHFKRPRCPQESCTFQMFISL